MFRYLIKRLLLFIPTLIVISLLAFMLTLNAPGDPVEKMLESGSGQEATGAVSYLHDQQKQYWTHRLGLDLPVFYISMEPFSFPDTLYRIPDASERRAVLSLLKDHGNWPALQRFRMALYRLMQEQQQLTNDSAYRLPPGYEMKHAGNRSAYFIRSLLHAGSLHPMHPLMDSLRSLFRSTPQFSGMLPLLDESAGALQEMESETMQWKNLVPVLHWHASNQYHRWIFGDGHWLTGRGSEFSRGLIRGDLGISYTYKQPVSLTIANKIGWSLLLTFLSVLLAYAISLPMGIRAATHRGSWFDQSSSLVLFLLHSMPAFWVAILLLMTFANPDVLRWFPSSGVKPVGGYPEDANLLVKIRISLPYLILPLIAYTYSSLAFLSRLTRTSMLEVLEQDYIRTAWAKGLPSRRVIYRHAFRNSLLPVITVFANILPAAIGGSVILESIFSIPGMGQETFRAIQRQDVPMIAGVFTLTGVLTLVGYLLADLLYAIADPRITYSDK